MAISGCSKFIPVFGENLGTAIFGHSEFYTSLFGENCWKKFRMAIFGHSEFIPVFWEKLSEKIQNGHFWPFQI